MRSDRPRRRDVWQNRAGARPQTAGGGVPRRVESRRLRVQQVAFCALTRQTRQTRQNLPRKVVSIDPSNQRPSYSSKPRPLITGVTIVARIAPHPPLLHLHVLAKGEGN